MQADSAAPATISVGLNPTLASDDPAMTLAELQTQARATTPINFFLAVPLAALSALLCGLAYTSTELARSFEFTIDLGFLAWFGLIPYFWVLRRAGKWTFAFSAMTFGGVFFGVTLGWLESAHVAAFVATVAVGCLHFFWTGLFIRWILRWHAGWAVITAPAAWLFFDWLTELILVRFPWFMLGYTQLNNPWVIQIADITGVWGVTFVVVAVNVALLNILHAAGDDKRFRFKRIWIPTGLGIAAALGAHAYGIIRLPYIQARIDPHGGPTVALLQPAIPQGLKREQEGTDASSAQIVDFQRRMVDITRDVLDKGRTRIEVAPIDGRPAPVWNHMTVFRTTSAPVDLLVFPETAFPYSLALWDRYRDDPAFADDATIQRTSQLIETCRRINTPHGGDPAEAEPPLILLATLDYLEPRRFTEVARNEWHKVIARANRITAVTLDDRLAETYDKIELVPIGEYVPFGDQTDIFRDLTMKITRRDYATDLRPGSRYTVFDLDALRAFGAGGAEIASDSGGPAGGEASANEREPTADHTRRFAAHVCFESTFPEITRQFANAGAGMVINVSNDGWFAGSSELEQVWSLSRMRAVESRLSQVRCVNSGVSGICLPDGSMFVTLDDPSVEAKPHPAMGPDLVDAGQLQQVPGVLIARVPMMKKPVKTFYMRWGPWLPVLGFICIGWSVAFALLKPRRRPR